MAGQYISPYLDQRGAVTQLQEYMDHQRSVSLNVLDFAHVDATGKRDSTKGVLEAISEMGDGYTLEFPPGTYLLQERPNLVNLSNVSIIGHGATLKIADSTLGALTVLELIRLSGCHYVHIIGLTLNGNRANQTGYGEYNHGIGIASNLGDACDHVWIERCRITNTAGDNIYIAQGSTDVWIRGCDLSDPNDTSPRQGVAIVKGSRVWITDNYFSGSAFATGQWAVDLEPNTNTDVVDNVVIRGNHFGGAGWYGHINIGAANTADQKIGHVTIEGNHFETVDGEAVRCVPNNTDATVGLKSLRLANNWIGTYCELQQPGRCAVSGNHFTDDTTNGYCLALLHANDGATIVGNTFASDLAVLTFGLKVLGGCNGVTVGGNLFTASANNMGYAIYVDDAATIDPLDVMISGNTFRSDTGTLSDALYLTDVTAAGSRVVWGENETLGVVTPISNATLAYIQPRRGAAYAAAANDASPDVTGLSTITTANSNPTTITALDGGVVGQTVVVLIGDAKTTIDFTGTNLKGNAGVDWVPANGDHMTCTYNGTNWYCTISDNTA